MNDAEELRVAAATARLLAGAVLTDRETDVLVAVAALLEQTAGRHIWINGQNGGGDWSPWCRGCGYFPADPGSESCPDMAAALAVARAIGG